VITSRDRIRHNGTTAEGTGERCERSFAHVRETGGMQRTWLRGVGETTKRYLMAAAAHNLGRVLLKLFGVGQPRGLQEFGSIRSTFEPLVVVLRAVHLCWLTLRQLTAFRSHDLPALVSGKRNWPRSTDCRSGLASELRAIVS